MPGKVENLLGQVDLLKVFRQFVNVGPSGQSQGMSDCSPLHSMPMMVTKCTIKNGEALLNKRRQTFQSDHQQTKTGMKQIARAPYHTIKKEEKGGRCAMQLILH